MSLEKLTSDQRKSITGFQRMGIDIEILEDNMVQISQKSLINGFILSQQQLIDRAREVFPDKKWKIIANVYSLDVKDITIDWINQRMDEFGIKRNDLIKQLALDKASLSSLFSGERGLTKSMRAAFYFYFLTYELNRDLRPKYYTEEVAQKIKELLKEIRSTTDQSKNKVLRDKLRSEYKFRISQYDTSKQGFTPEDFDMLVDQGRIVVLQD
jgi:plasmid maintenance system antidote protein VapI